MPLDAFEPTLFELSNENGGRAWLPDEDTDLGAMLPADSISDNGPALPIVSELDVVRHFTKLSRRNFCIESGFYPLGSCTMKYNPKICDSLAGLPGFAKLHPEIDADLAQGTLGIMDDISGFLCEITGMDQVTTNPCAGAHGELCGMLLVRAYHRDHGSDRDTVLAPDSAHGTNPATAAMVGYKTLEVKSNAEGCVDLEDLKSKLNDKVAALMLTNPNTLGLFEKDILEISKIVHDAGALLYYDGANLNAIAGVARPGDMGFDVVHINLHKTFSTPHGGGGPGSGPVGVKSRLVPYLPVPLIEKDGSGAYSLDYSAEKSIGQLSTFYGNAGIVLRAYIYMRMHGAVGIRQNSVHAVLNARYLKSKLERLIPAEIDADNMHEFVLTLKDKARFGEFNAMAFAKNLIDHGYHAPTVYFPLIVKEALMMEPTETESKRTLDEFAATVEKIMTDAKADPEKALHAPYTTPVRRLDEVTAARSPVLTQPCLE